MSGNPTPRTVLWGTLAWHPAFVAWSRMAECPAPPERLEVLRQGNKSATYRYSETDPAHLALAARWVGSLHTGATPIDAARALPDGGPARYLDYLRAGRDAVLGGGANPGLTAADVKRLKRLVADLDALERDWTTIERACSDVPATVVHGDFRPRNAYLRSDGTQLHVFPIDWEHAGWGVPAADLTRIDLPTYWMTVRAS